MKQKTPQFDIAEFYEQTLPSSGRSLTNATTIEIAAQQPRKACEYAQ